LLANLLLLSLLQVECLVSILVLVDLARELLYPKPVTETIMVSILVLVDLAREWLKRQFFVQNPSVSILVLVDLAREFFI